jgi:hypothetical protein
MVEYLTLFSFASWKCRKNYVRVMIDAIEFLPFLKPKDHFGVVTSVHASVALIFVY